MARRPTLSCRAIALAAAALAPLSPAVVRGGEKPIQDNSFLIEEAYNQEPGVIQHVGTFDRARGGGWVATFTEEWPVRGQTHQASVTLSYGRPEPQGGSGLGDVALNYRWQAAGSGDATLAVAPRLTVLLPTGDAASGLGDGGAGMQANVPISLVLGRRFVTHVNAGGTWVPRARVPAGGRGALTTVALGQSLVWLAHPRVNVLAEAVYTRRAQHAPGGVERSETLTIDPGVRAALDFSSGLQIVPGVGVPIGVGPSRGERSVFLYLSFEHPFRLAGPTAEGAARRRQPACAAAAQCKWASP